jgi:hypothetical protein
MSHDIVKLLRDVPRGIGGHYHHLMQKAADEIERLRAGGCARDQRTTQFCTEAVALEDRLRELSGEAGKLLAERDGYLHGNRQTLAALAEANEIAKRYKAERDEARREVCVWSCRVVRADRWMPTERVAFGNEEDVAKARGWDCFKGANNER